MNDLKKCIEYNQKIDRKFIQYLSVDNPFNNNEIMVGKKEEFEELLNMYRKFIKAKLTGTSIRTIAEYIFGKELELDSKEINDIISTSKKATIREAYMIMFNLIVAQTFYERTIEMAKIIFNKIIIDNGYCPVVFYRKATDEIVNMFSRNEACELIEKFFLEMYEINLKKFNTKGRNIAKNEVVEGILKNEDLLKNIFHISSIGLFGSFAVGTPDEYSDIDIWIRVGNLANGMVKQEVSVFFETIFERRIDVHIVNSENDFDIIGKHTIVF